MAAKLPASVWRVPGADKPAAAAVKEPPLEPQPIEEVIAETQQQLVDRGWCLWRCNVLDGEVIIVVRDELVTGYPAGFPVYTTQELIELAQEGVGVEAIRLVHEAKKSCGAKVQEVKHAGSKVGYKN